MKRICFLPFHATSWAELFSLAKEVKAEGRLEPVMLLREQLAALHSGQCQAAGVAWRGLTDLPPQESRPASGLGSRLGPARLARSLRWRIQGPAAELDRHKQAHLRLLTDQLAQIDQALEEIRPVAALVAGDRIPSWELPLIAACRRRGIPTLAPPVAYVGDKESLLPQRASIFHQARNYPRLKDRFPQQVCFNERTGQEVFFYQAPMLAALAELDLLPANPWAHGGSNATLVLAESEEAKERYVRDGADPAKIMVTGHRAHDELYRDLRAQSPGAAPGQNGPGPVVLSLPQLFEENQMGWEAAKEEIAFLGRTLAEAAPGRTVISLHPKMDPRRYEFLEREYGLVLAKERLSTFLARGHLFLATFSSTLFWATLCQVPAIVFDFYGYDYHNWDFLTGVTIIKQKERLGPEVVRLLGDPDHHQRMAGEQKRWAARLSPFDGQCTRRILDQTYRSAGV